MGKACVPFGSEWFLRNRRDGSGPSTGSDGGEGLVGHEEVNCPEGAREAGLGHHWACRLQGASLHTPLPRRAGVVAPYRIGMGHCQFARSGGPLHLCLPLIPILNKKHTHPRASSLRGARVRHSSYQPTFSRWMSVMEMAQLCSMGFHSTFTNRATMEMGM